MKNKTILLSTLFISGLAFSQVGVNTESPKATFDVMGNPIDLSKTDGFIAPRLKGSELKAKDTNYDTPQTGAIVYVTEALAAVDTTAKTVNVTAVGYFYFDGSIWQKITVNSATWNLQSTTTTATLNSQSIYQNGNVGIGNFSAANPIARLDVRGAVRGGTPHANEINGTSAIGTNSVAFGTNNRTSGNSSASFGNGNVASGSSSMAQGFGNTISGSYNFALGFGNIVSSITNGAIGTNNSVTHSNSYVIGYGLGSTSPYELTIGKANVNFGGDASNYVITDVAFAVGNGLSVSNRDNALTLLKNGHLGLGIYQDKPTERIDIGTDDGFGQPTGQGSIRIRAINTAAYAGNNTMKILVADTSGILKSIAQSNTLTAANGNLISTVNGLATTPAVSILTSADNGLTPTNGKVQLGGLLTGATTITADATKTLAIAGLQTGTSTDNVVVADTNGVLKSVTQASLIPATTNTLTATNGNLISTVNGVANTPAVGVLTSSDNGLTSTNGKVELGGLLTAATTIIADTTNTLAIAGLQAGSTSDKIVVADTNGVLKTVTNTLTNTSIVKTTADYTILATDFTVLVNATGGGVTVTLPTAATSTGRILAIRKTDETANVVTFSVPVKISETTSFTTLNLNSTIRIQSDGTNWYKID